jgi:hypothetical protein
VVSLEVSETVTAAKRRVTDWTFLFHFSAGYFTSISVATLYSVVREA